MNIKLSGIYKNSIVDGPGIRYVIYTQGCLHQCIGCHNPSTHDIAGGYLSTTKALIEEINQYPLIKGLTISGGEPFLQVEAIYEITSVFYNIKDIIVYTGFEYEYLLNKSKNNSRLMSLLKTIDYLIDGKYIQELRDLSLNYKGSSNQRVINVKESLDKNKIVLSIL